MQGHTSKTAHSTTLTLLAALVVTGCGQEADTPRAAPAPVRVIAEPIAYERERTRVEAVGTSRALKSVELFPAASGEVVAVNFEPGQFVKAGDVLVELDSREQKLAVELARVRLADAERLYGRYQRTGSSGAVLPTEIDAAATAVEAARIELDRASVALDDRFIRAPFDGHVDFTEIDPGDRIGTNTAITTIDDRTSLLVSFDVPEIMVGELEEGSEVTLTAWDTRGATLAGAVTEIGSRIDPDTRTFNVRAVVDNETDTLRPGMSFRVSVNVEGREYAVVAETAVKWGANGAYIWVIRDGKAVRMPVKIIQRRRGRALIDADFSAGDDVVVEGIQRLRDGSVVDYERSSYAGREGGPDGDGQASAR